MTKCMLCGDESWVCENHWTSRSQARARAAAVVRVALPQVQSVEPGRATAASTGL